MSGTAETLAKPKYNSEAAERAHRQVLIAAGRIPFTLTRFIVHASPRGLPYNLILPAAQ